MNKLLSISQLSLIMRLLLAGMLLSLLSGCTRNRTNPHDHFRQYRDAYQTVLSAVRAQPKGEFVSFDSARLEEPLRTEVTKVEAAGIFKRFYFKNTTDRFWIIFCIDDYGYNDSLGYAEDSASLEDMKRSYNFSHSNTITGKWSVLHPDWN